jgi:uncharacterized protein YodC (DUF2158 family)
MPDFDDHAGSENVRRAMSSSFNIGDLVRVKTHSDPLMRVVDIELGDEKSGANGVVSCEWDDHGTSPPTHRRLRFAVDDLVPAFSRNT